MELFLFQNYLSAKLLLVTLSSINTLNNNVQLHFIIIFLLNVD